MSELSCININFDSLGWSLAADPNSFTDPSFFQIADRFFELSQKHDFKYTIFIIGKDLENPEVASRVRDWCDWGHEIGNHSYNHKQNLGFLAPSEIEFEVMKSHELIDKACGQEPRGFIAPAWCTSSNLIRVLRDNGYLYDTSLFPSYFMWIVAAKVYWNFRKDERRQTVLQRRDWIANLLGGRHPFRTKGSSAFRRGEDGLLILPLPVSPFLRVPLWHTMSFVLSERWFERVLRSTLKSRYFYYVTHPADLADLSDLPDGRDAAIPLERIEVPLAVKKASLDRYVRLIKDASSQLVTLRQIAEHVIAEDLNASKRKAP